MTRREYDPTVKSRFGPPSRGGPKASQRRAKYGIEPEQYDRLLSQQDGKCAICQRPELGKGRWGRLSLGVDHDHQSKKVRGLLCGDCNRALGLFHDNPGIIARATLYLITHRRNCVPNQH